MLFTNETSRGLNCHYLAVIARGNLINAARVGSGEQTEAARLVILNQAASR